MTDLTFEGAGGLHLQATRFGDPSRRPVLLLHGFGQSRAAWLATARRLSDANWQVLTLDLRGHGDSDRPPTYHLDDFQEDVRIVSGSFATPPAIVGASMGGILTLLAHDEHRIAAAIGLVDVVPSFNLAAGQRVQAFMFEHRDGFDDLAGATAAVSNYLPEREGRNAQGLMRNMREDPDGRLRWKWDPRLADGVEWLTGRDSDIEVVTADIRQRMTRAASRLDVPTLLVRGGLSEFVPIEAAREFAQLVPEAELVDVSSAGHMVAGDQNDAFADAVVAFLSRHHPPNDEAAA